MTQDLYSLAPVRIRLVREAVPTVYSRQPLTNPAAIAAYLRDLFIDLDREVFAVVNLQSDFSAVGLTVAGEQGTIDVCSVGSLANTLVAPREVVKSSILQNAAAVVLAHNHPSGSLIPSKEDLKVTEELKKVYELLQIPVMDQLIISPIGYYSFKEHGEYILPESKNN